MQRESIEVSSGTCIALRTGFPKPIAGHEVFYSRICWRGGAVEGKIEVGQVARDRKKDSICSLVKDHPMRKFEEMKGFGQMWVIFSHYDALTDL